MPDYQRVRVRSLRTRIWPPFWNLFCPACGQVGSDLSNNRALALDEAREHWATCPALRLQRLLADLERDAATARQLGADCCIERGEYKRKDRSHGYWEAWAHAHASNYNYLRALVEKYREAPDA